MTYYSALHYAAKAEKSATSAANSASQAFQASGKIIQLGFDGAIEDGKLVFKHAPSGVEIPYDLLDDYEYEVDLLWNSDVTISQNTPMVIKNGSDTITFVSALHRSADEPATIADMAPVMRESNGNFRWLFKAAYKITPNGTKVLLLYPVISSGGAGAGLEIGDIGFAPLGIDESQNKRRYLNGQVISQSQFESFTNKIKAAIQLYPSLATSETNWQAEVANSKLGQCGRFVIDDEAGTIRLPKVVNISGLYNLALMGSIKAESLPNITGKFDTDTGIFSPSGAFSAYKTAGRIGAQGSNNNSVSFDASRSSSTYQDNAPVQQEAVQYPYFIQVATGAEESVDVTREIELNNPFFLGMSQYFESEPNNASWLISNGSFHSGTVYKSFYEWLLKIYNGTETVDGVSVKASTDTYDDYDYVINTADTTFRLPLLDGSESLSGSNFDSWDLSSSGQSYVAPTNGRVSLVITATASDQHAEVNASNGNIDLSRATASGQTVCASAFANRGNNIKVYYNTSATIHWLRFYPAIGNGSLYFYVGETIQDANVIAASQVLTDIANLKGNTVGIPDYTAGIDWSSAGTYTAPTSGWITGFIRKSGSASSASLYVNNVLVTRAGNDTAASTYWYPINIFIEKGQIYKSEYTSSAIANCVIKFFPCKGAN